MSWNAYYSTREGFNTDTPMSSSPAKIDLTGVVAEQWKVARNAAAGVLSSGAVGNADKEFSITLSGHANPRHEPAEGWANDCISITITQKSA